MASTQLIYRINNEPLNVMNIITYLCVLVTYNIIPKFTLDFTKTDMTIIVIYSLRSTSLPLSGYTIITYNIPTKKWKSYINIGTIVNGTVVNNIFNRFQHDYPYLIENNLLKINYKAPYVEYILESDYIEDILEPSLNSFNANHGINPRDCVLTGTILSNMRYILMSISSEIDIARFYQRVDMHEQFLLFESIKETINKSHYLPDELWRIVYQKFCLSNPPRQFRVIPAIN
jgi:hypothetical protein